MIFGAKNYNKEGRNKHEQTNGKTEIDEIDFGGAVVHWGGILLVAVG